MRAPAFTPRANLFALLAGVAAGPLAAAELPLEMPSYHDDKGNELVPSLSLEGAFFPQSQSWFGKSKDNLGETSNYWFEQVGKLAVSGQAALDGYGTMYGKVSGIFAATQRTDAAGSDVPDDTPSDLAWEDAYVGWRSANLFESSLGTDAHRPVLRPPALPGRLGLPVLGWRAATVDSAPPTGSGRARRSSRPPSPRSPRTASRRAASFSSPTTTRTPTPSSTGSTCNGGTDDLGSIGGGFYHIFEFTHRHARRDERLRHPGRSDPAQGQGDPARPHLKGEFTYEKNGDTQEGFGYYGELGYDFGESLPWTPYVSYRYAHFSGDDPNSSKDQNFDPLFYGFSDWGTWFQGEILGEYVLLNQNLNSSTIRLTASPTEDLKLNLLYYYFWLDDAAGFGTEGSSFADEVDLIADYTLNDHVFFSLVGGVANPRNGASNFTGGNNLWSYGMFYTNITF